MVPEQLMKLFSTHNGSISTYCVLYYHNVECHSNDSEIRISQRNGADATTEWYTSLKHTKHSHGIGVGHCADQQTFSTSTQKWILLSSLNQRDQSDISVSHFLKLSTWSWLSVSNERLQHRICNLMSVTNTKNTMSEQRHMCSHCWCCIDGQISAQW